MKTKKWVLPVCIFAGVSVLCIVVLLAVAGIMSAKGYGISVGRLYLSNDKACLVDEGKAMIMSDQSDGKKLFDRLNIGDLILVIHDGVNLSYPAQTGAYRVFRLSKGNENDLPENLGMGVDEPDGTETVLAAPTIDFDTQLTQPELVRIDRGYANISLTIPDGWEYETEVMTDSGGFSIAFQPAGRSEGKIRVLYYDRFGVCGTGLESETIRLGNYEARKGTYDGHKVWDFIRLIGTPGYYVIENEGAGPWWDEYGGEAMQILNTLVAGDGIIHETEAIAIAKGEAAVEYNQTWTSYDSETGLWTVTFGKSYPGGDQTVTITCEGKVTDIQYG